MSNLISVYDLEILPDVFVNKKAPKVQESLKSMLRKRKFHEEEYEDVIDFGEFILALHQISGRKNNVK